VRLNGLDPQKKYKVKEINAEGKESDFSGDYLMKIGLSVSSEKELTSKVFEITAM
jgi:alpha-galactosidase